MSSGRFDSWKTFRLATPLLFLVALVYTVLAIQWSFRMGRLANDPVADDVGYLLDGVNRLNIAQQQGPGPFLQSLLVNPPHSPWSAALALTGFSLFGVNDWSPYALNGCLILILLYAGHCYLGRSNPINQALILSVIFLTPLALTAVHDFRPDFAVGVFTALSSLRIIWLACHERVRDKELQTYLLAGMLVGVGYLAKPTFFPHTTMMCVAAFGLAEISYRIFSPDRVQLRPTLIRMGGLIVGVVVVAGPYFFVGWRHIINYLFANAVSGANASIWKVPGGIWGSFRTYLIGSNMVRMLGLFEPLLLIWILIGLVATGARKSFKSLAFIVCGVLLSTLSACIISVGQMDNPFFALPWELTFVLTAIIAIGEASRSETISVVAVGAAGLSLVLFFLHPPTINVWAVSEDIRPGYSLNFLALREVTDSWSADPQSKEKPSLFATFFGSVNIVTQRWLSLKNHIRIDLSDIDLSASLEEQMQHAQISDFVEVADPASKWLPRLPSTLLQGPILTRLRALLSFEEMPPIVGKEGTVYLFRRMRLLNPRRGFSGLETRPLIHAWAIEKTAELAFPEMRDTSSPTVYSFDLSSPKKRSVKITAPDGQVQVVSLTPNQRRHVEMPILRTNVPNSIIFETDTDGAKAENGDPRELFFDVANPMLSIETNASNPGH